jgi:hypothetical protein
MTEDGLVLPVGDGVSDGRRKPTPTRKWSDYPGLAHPTRGSRLRGRIQVAARRALITNDGTATTAQVAAWAYARKLLRRRLGKSDYRHVRRALDQIAERVGRGGGRGRPILWRAKCLQRR